MYIDSIVAVTVDRLRSIYIIHCTCTCTCKLLGAHEGIQRGVPGNCVLMCSTDQDQV